MRPLFTALAALRSGGVALASRGGRAALACALVVAALMVWTLARAAISYVAVTNASGAGRATSIVVNVPAGVAANDYLIAAITQDDVGTISAPAGWTTLITSDGTKEPRLRIFGRVASASEPASYTFTSTFNDYITGGMMAFRGVDTTTPVAASGIQANNTGTSCTAPSISPLVTNTLLVGIWANQAGGALTVPASMTGSVNANSGAGSIYIASAYQALAASGATGTRVAGMTSATCNGALIALRPGSAPTYNISGTVFEDVNYGGGAGRTLAASAGSPVNGATVELYNSAGTYLSSSTTASGGTYTFSGLAAGTYYVRVVNSAVASQRSGSSGALRGVMTYRTNASTGTATPTTDYVGGTNPALADPGAGSSGAAFNTSTGVFSAVLSGTAQSFSAVTLSSANITGVDFGFNFDTVVNANDSGQGSLRQAMTNANTLGGDAALAQSGRTAAVENLIFMLGNGSSAAGLRSTINLFSGGVATVAPASALPALTTSMVIDAQTQPGWSANPILELNGNGTGGVCLQLSSGSITLRGWVINRCPGDAVNITGGSAHLIQGNWIGLNNSGTAASAAAGSSSKGIALASTSGVLIGGTSVAQRNVISGNTYAAIYIGSSTTSLSVTGNYIGTNAAGSGAVGNQVGGIRWASSISGTSGIAIGGSGAGQGNVISGNTGIGVRATDGAPLIAGNIIGRNAADSATMGNSSDGIQLSTSVNGATIGGTSAATRNVISGNSGAGVNLLGSVSGVAILGNSIYGNGGIGIDLGSNGVTVNDGAKTAGQANGLMDHPVFTSARARGNQLTIAGYVGSAPGQALFAGSRVEVFIADGDASGYGEGQTYLGTLTTGASGDFSATVTLPVAALAIGSQITGSATDGSNNTSEFGPRLPSLIVDIVVNSNLDEADSGVGDGRCLTASGVCTLRAALAELNAWPVLATAPTITFAIPGCTGYGAAGCSIAPATALPSVTRSLTIDATTQSGWNATSFAPIIELNGAAAPAGTGGLVIAADNSTVRGLVINRFNGPGIALSGNGNIVAGNWLGTDNSGTSGAGNTGASGFGVRITGSSNRIGGSTAADRNVISANATGGIAIAGGSGNLVRGNTIGLNAADSTALPNATGVFISSGSGSTIGGLLAGEGNLISGNTKAVAVTSGAGHSILGNRIYANSSLGIDLGNDGASSNDGAYSAGQPNLMIDTPVITGAGIDSAGTTMTVYGAIGTGSGQAIFAGARVEFFKAAPDASGRGQGQAFLGALVADGNGRFNGTVSFALGQIVVGDAVTATATDSAGNTSEFGPNWTSTTVAGLTPSGFNAFDSDTAAGAITGIIRTRVAGAASAFDVVALNSSGTGLHPGFTGNVALMWIDARNDSGAITGSCRASWVDVAAAGTAAFSNNARVTVALTPPPSSTRVMRLKMTYVSGGSTTTACSSDAFAAIPASLTFVASDADAATAGTARTLANVGAGGGVVHRAGRPFTVSSQARDANGALMTAYDGTPVLATTACVLPAACAAAALGGSNTAASAGVYTNNGVTYAEVGAVTLQLTDTTYADIDSADTAAATRRIASAAVNVGRFVPDSLTAAVTGSGQFATANGACMATGQGSTFFGQGFGWASAPQVTVTARNAAGVITSYWSGTLMKLAPGAGNVPTLAVANAGSATLTSSYGTVGVTDLGAGQARLVASTTDRFMLELPPGTVQPGVSPTWTWSLAVTDASEAGTSGNPTLLASTAQNGVAFDRGAVFYSGRLTLAPAHGDARAGVRSLVQLQRWTAAGWVTMTEDRGCITVQRQNLGVASPVGVFTTAGICAAPLAASTTTAGGRAWLALPATPGAAPGRLMLSLAGEAASGSSCTAGGAVQALVPMGLPYLTGGAASTGPAALATWGPANRDAVLRRETW